MKYPKFLKRIFPTGHCNDEFPMDWQSLFTRILIRILCFCGGRKNSNSVWARADNVLDMDESIDYIEKMLKSGKPFMAGKIGTGDMETLERFFAMHSDGSRFKKWIKLLTGKGFPFWFDNWIRTGITVCAGVFPATDEGIEEFCRIFAEYCKGFDAIPTWLPGEKWIYELVCPNSMIIKLESLAPFAHPKTWYDALANKKVLVVHPYIKTIKVQYEKNVEFHAGQGPLPRFKELIQYRPVNSIGGKNNKFAKWKDALDFMIADIEKLDFDIALLGCGVYGVPLSVHIKRMGKQAIYTGGATQIIFGIKGKRWDHLGIYNEHWVRAFQEDIPQNMALIEGGTFL